MYKCTMRYSNEYCFLISTRLNRCVELQVPHLLLLVKLQFIVDVWSVKSFYCIIEMCSSELAVELALIPYSPRYSVELHDFFDTIPRFQLDARINSFSFLI